MFTTRLKCFFFCGDGVSGKSSNASGKIKGKVAL